MGQSRQTVPTRKLFKDFQPRICRLQGENGESRAIEAAPVGIGFPRRIAALGVLIFKILAPIVGAPRQILCACQITFQGGAPITVTRHVGQPCARFVVIKISL